MWKKAQKLLACLLAVLLLSSATALSPAVFAVDETSDAPVLQSGTAVIPADASEEQVKQLLFDALVANKAGLGEDFDAQSLDWEYYCTGTYSVFTSDEWGSIAGFTSTKKSFSLPTPLLILRWQITGTATIRCGWPEQQKKSL